MGTLLKAKLLKTNDPLIMLKCYLEDILKQDGATWDELIESMITTNEPKIPAKLVNTLQSLNTEELPRARLLQGRIKPDKDSTTEVPTDDPYVRSVRESNVRSLLNAIKDSEMDPTVTKPIIQGLENLIAEIMASQKTGQQKIRQTRGKVTYGKTDEVNLKDAIRQLENISSALQTSKLDFDGDHVHDETLERLLPTVIKSKFDIAQLRRLSGREYAEETASKPESELKELRNKIHKTLNSMITYNHHKEGKIKGRLLDALLYAYEQNVGVALADVANHRNIRNKRDAIWQQVNTKGGETLRELATKDLGELKDFISQRETAREKDKVSEQIDERGRGLLEEAKEGKTISWGGF